MIVEKTVRVIEIIGVVSNSDEIVVVMNGRVGKDDAATLGLVFGDIDEAIAEVEYLLKVLEAKREQLMRRKRDEEEDDW